MTRNTIITAIITASAILISVGCDAGVHDTSSTSVALTDGASGGSAVLEIDQATLDFDTLTFQVEATMFTYNDVEVAVHMPIPARYIITLIPYDPTYTVQSFDLEVLPQATANALVTLQRDPSAGAPTDGRFEVIVEYVGDGTPGELVVDTSVAGPGLLVPDETVVWDVSTLNPDALL
mgnify:CR=1 FL=1